MSIAECLELSDTQMRMSNPAPLPDRKSVLYGLQQVRDILSAENIPFVLVGGLALAHYGYVRGTADIDIMVLAPDNNRTINAFLSNRFKKHKKDGYAKSLKAKAVLMATSGYPAIRVDILSSNNEFFRYSIEKAEYDKFLDLYVAPIESIIVMKWLAHMDRKKSSVPEDKFVKSRQDAADANHLVLMGTYNKDILMKLAGMYGVAVKDGLVI